MQYCRFIHFLDSSAFPGKYSVKCKCRGFSEAASRKDLVLLFGNFIRPDLWQETSSSTKTVYTHTQSSLYNSIWLKMRWFRWKDSYLTILKRSRCKWGRSCQLFLRLTTKHVSKNGSVGWTNALVVMEDILKNNVVFLLSQEEKVVEAEMH